MALSAGCVLCVIFIAVQLIDPQGIIRCDLRFIELFKYMFDITDQRDRRTCILADLGGVHIDVNEDLVLRDQIRLADRAVCHSGADHNDHIGIVHSPVAVGLSVISYHSVE